MPDSAINFSDIAESSESQLRKARRVGRPKRGDAKQLIAIRVRPSLLARIREEAKDRGKPYQTLIHEILEAAMKRRA
jgi:predicted DNA binding CopG/RHH family protein